MAERRNESMIEWLDIQLDTLSPEDKTKLITEILDTLQPETYGKSGT
jgi:hypothetical protein